MKLKTTIGIGLIGLLASHQTIAQNVDNHLIKKKSPFYHPIVDFDGDGNQDFLRVKRSKDKQTFKLYFEKDENTPKKYLLTIMINLKKSSTMIIQFFQKLNNLIFQPNNQV